jgi:hypothetical protein
MLITVNTAGFDEIIHQNSSSLCFSTMILYGRAFCQGEEYSQPLSYKKVVLFSFFSFLFYGKDGNMNVSMNSARLEDPL